MSTPLATTTIRIERPPDHADDGPGGAEPDYVDPWDDSQPLQAVESGIAAHIGRQRGGANRDGANVPAQQFELSADLCDLRKDDFVVDETTLLRFRVDTVFDRVTSAAPMLDRTTATLMRVDGATPNPGH